MVFPKSHNESILPLLLIKTVVFIVLMVLVLVMLTMVMIAMMKVIIQRQYNSVYYHRNANSRHHRWMFALIPTLSTTGNSSRWTEGKRK